MNYSKFALAIFIFLASVTAPLLSQVAEQKPAINDFKLRKLSFNSLADSTKKTTPIKKFRAAGIFLSVGSGLNVPLKSFGDNSIPTFGILGRLEYTSTTIFPFVIGGEITYFSYLGKDQFTTLYILNTFRTHITSYGLSIEYSLARLLNSPYSIPFLTIDVKTNKIRRDIDPNMTFQDLPVTDSRVSVSAGFGVTLFVVDFYVKYNYMKDLSNFGAYAKIKFPVIRF